MNEVQEAIEIILKPANVSAVSTSIIGKAIIDTRDIKITLANVYYMSTTNLYILSCRRANKCGAATITEKRKCAIESKE